MNPEPAMSDEVSQFLEQVERLRGQQIEDEEMRAREREEFLAAKRERQARREGESSILSRAVSFSLFPTCSKFLWRMFIGRLSPLMGGFDFRRCLVAVVLAGWSYRRFASIPWFIYFLPFYGPRHNLLLWRP